MTRPIRAAALLLSAAVACTFLPQPAESQLGGLARRARDAVQGKAEEKVEEAMPFTPAPAPEFDDRVLEITDRRLERMLEAFEAEAVLAAKAGAEYDARLRSHEAAMAEYEGAMDAWREEDGRWDVCVEEFRAREAEAAAANEARVEKAIEEMNTEEFEAYVEELAVRGEKILAEVEAGKNDPETRRRHEEFQAEMARVQIEQARRMAAWTAGTMAEVQRAGTEDKRLEEACGKEPEMPVAPDSELTGPEGLLVAAGAEKAQLTSPQYAIMRERILYWAKENGRPSGMGFSADEIEVLGDAKGDIEKVVVRMKKANVPL